MARFTGIPALPQAGVEEWQYRFLSAVKQNMELLIGTRGEQDGSSRAVTKASITVGSVPNPSLQALSASGAGFTVGGAQVPSLADYQALLSDVQRLNSDVAQLRTTVNTLISQLRN